MHALAVKHLTLGDTPYLAQVTSISNLKEDLPLKLRIAFAICLALAALPAMAQTLYENGPINGTTDGWTINNGFVVSDTFTTSPNSDVEGLVFGAWTFPGDVLQTAEITITSAEFGGTVFADVVATFTQSGCSGNQYGYNVCTETASFPSINLAGGTYWLNLQNAVVSTGDPVYWDENSGVGCMSPGCPSSASENSVGTIPSEAFTVLGTETTTTTTGTIPEPSNIMLFGSGILGVAGLMRRKLF
jgi:hypothetical protein